uniref:HAT C-terminal dimerisation domain-containing protein n=1 Tax=Nelumbo nucifera TaxID=4432 RepID=A0A822XZ51_NELNU|nr:TPA_asm: hypothetical protein HUJ06_026467 [Nelumbo nucifera]
MNDSIDSNFFHGYDSFVDDSDDMTMKSELDHYLEKKLLPRDPDFVILAWWKSNEIKYPTLQKIARDILAIPLSTMAFEFAFNAGDRLVFIQTYNVYYHKIEYDSVVNEESVLTTSLSQSSQTT